MQRPSLPLSLGALLAMKPLRSLALLLLLVPSSLACASCGQSRFPTPGSCVVSGTTVNPRAEGCCADSEALELLGRLLDELGGSAYEATKSTVDKGNSPFGAAILHNQPGYPLLYADANQVQTAKTPTAHGEISTINGYFQKIDDDKRAPPADTIFLATHQPCSLCMSGLAFAGFRRVFYAFDFEMSVNGGEDAGDILDVSVLEELFTTTCGHIQHTNGMYTIVPMAALLQLLPCEGNVTTAAALQQERARFHAIQAKYAELGRIFQERMAASGGGTTGIQLLAKACVDCKPFPRQECQQSTYNPNELPEEEKPAAEGSSTETKEEL